MPDNRIGVRLFVTPELAVRADAQLWGTADRIVPGLRWGYLEWAGPGLGSFRVGQVPTPWSEAEDKLVGDPLGGPGIARRAGFFSPGGLGASFARDLDLEELGLGTASIEAGAYLADGLLGAGELATSSLRPSVLVLPPGSPADLMFLGTGPSVAGRIGLAWSQDWSLQGFGRWGYLQDSQLGIGCSKDSDWGRLFGELVASGSAPAYEPFAEDLAGQLGANYRLSSLWPGLDRFSGLLRLEFLDRNLTATARASDSLEPTASPSAELEAEIGLEYDVSSNVETAVGLVRTTDLRAESPASTLLRFRLGARF